MFRSDGAAPRRATTLALALVLVTAADAGACPLLPAPAPAISSAQSASAARPRPLVWDWRAGARSGGARANQAEIVQAVDRQRLGRGSWICSPAGSGMRSECFQR